MRTLLLLALLLIPTQAFATSISYTIDPSQSTLYLNEYYGPSFQARNQDIPIIGGTFSYDDVLMTAAFHVTFAGTSYTAVPFLTPEDEYPSFLTVGGAFDVSGSNLDFAMFSDPTEGWFLGFGQPLQGRLFFNDGSEGYVIQNGAFAYQNSLRDIGNGRIAGAGEFSGSLPNGDVYELQFQFQATRDPEPAAVPEPATLALLGLSGVLGIRRRRV